MRLASLWLIGVVVSAATVLSSEPPAPADECDRASHLLQAAEHLDAAGMHEQAKVIRGHAERLRNEELAQALAELARLKSKIRALEHAPKPAEQVLVKVQVLELSRTKLRRLGFDLTRIQRDSKEGLKAILEPAGGADKARETLRFETLERKTAAGLVEALRREKTIKVLAEPSLVTVDRRPAAYRIGGEVVLPTEDPDRPGGRLTRDFGTEIHCLPMLLGNNKLKLDIRARISQLDPTLDTMIDGQPFPGIRAVEVDTGLVMELGRTAVIAGLVQERFSQQYREATQDHDEVETIFLVTPQRVEALAPASIPQSGPVR